MTEYTVTSQHIRDYKNSRARCADWVTEIAEAEFYSPSVPRSELSDDSDGISEPSDAESSHSIPPRLMLRYGDGRPDIPIPHVHDVSPNRDPVNSVSRSQTYPQGSLYRSGSSVHSQARLREHERIISPVPEEIRVYPSKPAEGTRNGSFHIRSKSLPRNAFNPMQNHDSSTVPPLSLPPSQIVSQPLYPHPPSMQSPRAPPQSGHHISFSQSQPAPWQGHSSGRSHHHQPPSIVYAPSSHSRHAHYQPPAIYNHPPKIGPNGMIYSHSAPVPNTQYPPVGATPYPSVSSTGDRGRTRSSTRRSDMRNESTPTLSSGSGDSGSTYYVIPLARQKVHVLRTPDLTFYAQSSTSKSPTTPITPTSAGSFNKKPFFHRLLHFAERFSSAGSSKASSQSGHGKHLRRRHSSEHLR